MTTREKQIRDKIKRDPNGWLNYFRDVKYLLRKLAEERNACKLWRNLTEKKFASAKLKEGQ